MKSAIDRWFLDHPHSVNESYGEHFSFALGFGLTLIGAGLAAVVHAFVPVFHQRTASTTVKRLHARITNRGAPSQAAASSELQDLCPQI